MVGQAVNGVIKVKKEIGDFIPRRLSCPRVVGQKLLIIDDDPVFCIIISKLCGLSGISSTFYTSLKELDSIDLSQYTGAILDVHLGLANGIEVADCIRSIEPNLPLLMVSTSRLQSKKNGLDDLPFMHKSAGPQAIIEAAVDTIRGRR